MFKKTHVIGLMLSTTFALSTLAGCQMPMAPTANAEDGSYHVTFHSEMTFKDGAKRVADWAKTIAADGAVTGTGTIAWTGKTNKTVNLTFGGTEEAETATAADPASEAPAATP